MGYDYPSRLAPWPKGLPSAGVPLFWGLPRGSVATSGGWKGARLVQASQPKALGLSGGGQLERPEFETHLSIPKILPPLLGSFPWWWVGLDDP